MSRAEEMANAFENWVNGASREERAKFIEHLTTRTHRTIQQRCMTVFVGCIEAWAECLDSKRFDARNEATCKLAKKFCEGSGDKYDRQLPFI